MKSQIIYLPNNAFATLEVEINQDGEIMKAEAHVPAIDEWIDITKGFERRKDLVKRVLDEWQHLEWEDPDYAYECYRDSLADLKEALKPEGA